MFKSFKTGTVTFGIPTLAATILALIGGVAQAVNYYVVGISASLHSAIAVLLYFVIAAGVPPLTGEAFRAALHLPAWANGLVSAVLGALVLSLTTIHMAAGVHGAIAIVISVASALGFSAAVEPVSPATPGPSPSPGKK